MTDGRRLPETVTVRSVCLNRQKQKVFRARQRVGQSIGENSGHHGRLARDDYDMHNVERATHPTGNTNGSSGVPEMEEQYEAGWGVEVLEHMTVNIKHELQYLTAGYSTPHHY